MNNYFLVSIVFFLLLSCTQKQKERKKDSNKMEMNHPMPEDELHLSDRQVLLANIITDSVTVHPIGEEYIFSGIAGTNNEKVVSVSSRVMGRIEKLYFKNNGVAIRRGEPVYEINSDELNMAVKELRFLREKNKISGSEQVDMKKIIENVKFKLKLYGLSEEQISEYESGNENVSNVIQILSPSAGVVTSIDVREGDYVMEGGIIFHLADFSSLWVDGQLYNDDLREIKEGMEVKITFPEITGKEFSGKISFINPELNPSSKVDLIRVEIPNEEGKLKPGMQAWITVVLNSKNRLAVNTNAVITDSRGSTVWLKKGPNLYKSKMVTTGMENPAFTEIKSGLKRGDEVVISGAYLLNSEFIFKKGFNPMAGHDMSKMEK